MRNVTLSMDEDLIHKGKLYATRRGMSFNALVRESVRRMVASDSTDIATRLIDSIEATNGHSGGRRWSREEIYDE